MSEPSISEHDAFRQSRSGPVRDRRTLSVVGTERSVADPTAASNEVLRFARGFALAVVLSLVAWAIVVASVVALYRVVA